MVHFQGRNLLFQGSILEVTGKNCEGSCSHQDQDDDDDDDDDDDFLDTKPDSCFVHRRTIAVAPGRRRLPGVAMPRVHATLRRAAFKNTFGLGNDAAGGR